MTSIMIKKPEIDEAQFHNAILDSFQNFNYSSASFIAERLHFAVDNEKNRCVLAECYLAEGKYYNVFELLDKAKSTRSQYLFAMACFKLNKFKEAEDVLLNGDTTNNKGFLKNPDKVLNGAHGLYMLGQIYEKNSNKMTAAADCFKHAFIRNPFMFGALEKYLTLCQEPERALLDSFIGAFDYKVICSSNKALKMAILRSCFDDQRMESVKSELRDNKMLKSMHSENEKHTEVSDFRMSQHSSSKKSMQNPLVMLDDPNSYRKKATIAKNMNTPNIKKNKNYAHVFSKNKNSPKIKVEKELYSINTYFKTLAIPFIQFLTQNFKDSLEKFMELNNCNIKDPWIYNYIGRCLTELSEHKKAESFFTKSHTLDKARIEGKEFYSSCLWHLKKQDELSKLAFNYMKHHYFAPETWIIMANCYSLNQDHDTALEFLNRAIQINAQNSYAYCLSGHEHSCKANYDKAKDSYEMAIKLDPKNVRAYWGLGILNLKIEKYEIAGNYFTKAIKINKNCSFFYTQLAISFMRRQQFEDALLIVEKGEKIAPNDPFNLYTKAEILYELRQYQRALEHTQRLLKSVHKEAQVYVLLGRIHAKLGKKEKAHKNYMLANDLDKKLTQQLSQMVSELNTERQNKPLW